MEDHGNSGNLYLPQEIMDKILLRLPAKSICRFKCVSNPWKAMLSNPDFVNKHINRSIQNKDVVLQRRKLIFTDAADNGIYSINLDEFLRDHPHKNEVVGTDNNMDNHDEQVAAIELDYIYREHPSVRVPFSNCCNAIYCPHRKQQSIRIREEPSVRIPFFHSCNGLILLELSDLELYLVNPATSETKHLPKPHLDIYWYHTYNYHLYGFGFDSYTGEYQLMKGDIFVTVYGEVWEYDMEGTVFSVYNFQTDSWKRRPCFVKLPYIPVSPELHRNENSVFLNGRFHWVMKALRHEDEDAFVILALNAPATKTRKIPLPPELSNGHQLVKLGAFGDRLCVTLVTPEPRLTETHSEFWIMKEYGITGSWTKMRVSIPYAELSHSGFRTESHDLMIFGDKLVLCNFDGKGPQKFRKLSLREIGNVGRVGVHVESLVSIRDLTNP